MKLPAELYSGLKVPIFVQQDDGTHRYEFDGILIEQVENWRTLEPFIWEDKKPEKESINAVKELWKVMVTSNLPFDNGRILIRWVPKFHSKGPIRITEMKYDIEINENENW